MRGTPEQLREVGAALANLNRLMSDVRDTVHMLRKGFYGGRRNTWSPWVQNEIVHSLRAIAAGAGGLAGEIEQSG